MTLSNPVSEILKGIQSGDIIPYLGPGALDGVTNTVDGSAIPADSDSLILAMNDGKPMAPRLMYEFPRAAMNLELKKGRKFIERFLTTTYGEKQWSQGALHSWLATLAPQYVIDTNRDIQLQQLYGTKPHNLVLGLARVIGTSYRFKIYHQDGNHYREITQDAVDTALPLLFKPMGTPLPEANYVASDADCVDYITELMGGFAIPNFLKESRKGKKYLFMGMRFLRDTERMVLSDIIYDAADPAGWALVANPTDKELRYCEKKNIQVLHFDWQHFISYSTQLKLSA
jgi:hypothetical protein